MQFTPELFLEIVLLRARLIGRIGLDGIVVKGLLVRRLNNSGTIRNVILLIPCLFVLRIVLKYYS